MPDVDLKAHYTGDEYGSMILLNTKEGDPLTHFSLEKAGDTQRMRYQHDIELPIEKFRSGTVTVQGELVFKKV
jgi:hypothetical protein